MTQIGLTGKKITDEKLKYNKVQRKGGLVTIDLPVISCNLASQHETLKVEIGGYRSFVNYNKHREILHRQNKFHQKMRALRRNIRNKRLRQNGLTTVVQTGVTGDKRS